MKGDQLTIVRKFEDSTFTVDANYDTGIDNTLISYTAVNRGANTEASVQTDAFDFSANIGDRIVLTSGAHVGASAVILATSGAHGAVITPFRDAFELAVTPAGDETFSISTGMQISAKFSGTDPLPLFDVGNAGTVAVKGCLFTSGDPLDTASGTLSARKISFFNCTLSSDSLGATIVASDVFTVEMTSVHYNGALQYAGGHLYMDACGFGSGADLSRCTPVRLTVEGDSGLTSDFNGLILPNQTDFTFSNFNISRMTGGNSFEIPSLSPAHASGHIYGTATAGPIFTMHNYSLLDYASKALLVASIGGGAVFANFQNGVTKTIAALPFVSLATASDSQAAIIPRN